LVGGNYTGAKKAKNLVKFGGSFYCAELEKGGKCKYYVFNGFFMTMRFGRARCFVCCFGLLVESGD
jgi:hypothetical protein